MPLHRQGGAVQAEPAEVGLPMVYWCTPNPQTTILVRLDSGRRTHYHKTLMLLSPAANERLSLHARHALREARDIARYTKSPAIEPRHLLLALALEDGSLGSLLLENLGFQKDKLGKLCLKKTPKSASSAKPGKNVSPALSAKTQEAIKRAFFIASEKSYPYVGTEHLMSALLESDDAAIRELSELFEVSRDKVASTVESHLHFEQFPQMARLFDTPDWNAPETKSGSATPLLDQYTVDLAQAAETHPVTVVGRDHELERLMQILCRREKRNALLIGDPGVGKTALVTALATEIARGAGGPLLRGKRIRTLDLALLVAGTSFRGEFEQRLKELLKEVKHNRETILFIDEIHALVGTGNTQGGLDAANILKPALARGDIHVIGATTFSEYKRYFEKDNALDRRFQQIELSEPSPDQALAILRAAAPHYERFHKVVFPEATLRSAVNLAVRFIHDRHLPDKALDILDEAGALVRRRGEQTKSSPTTPDLHSTRQSMTLERAKLIESGAYDAALALQKRLETIDTLLVEERANESRAADQQPGRVVTEADLLAVLSHMTRIPEERLAQSDPAAELKRLKQKLAKRFVGQSHVTRSVLRLLTRAFSPTHDPRRPLGSLLLLGPTGVGKTYLAELLAEELFGDREALIRLDMSEFMERHSVAQILGAPAGYVGYGEGGKLTEAVRRRPYSIVLFDEIEKAHPDVANLLLQILDQGHLTDAEGSRVSFKNTLIVLTSNIGTASFTHAGKIGFSESLTRAKHRFETVKSEVLTELKETLRPELLSRFDETIVFEPLDSASLERIAALELEALRARLLARGIKLVSRPTVARQIAREAERRGDGARALKRYINDEVGYLVSAALLDNPQRKQLTLARVHDQFTLR